MKIKVFADEQMELEIRSAMRAAEGHCPCVLASARNKDTKCMCKAFREAPVGTVCHCGLYIKLDD